MTKRKRPNDLTDSEINNVLESFQDYFSKRLKNILPYNYDLPFKFTKDDFLQEVLIKMWLIIKYKFDPDKAELKTFIVSYTNWTIQYVISTVGKSLSYTGKISNRRTQIREIQKNLISLDKSNKYISSKYNGCNFDENDFTHNDRIDRLLYTNGIESSNGEDTIQWNHDFPIILDEIEKYLTDDEYTIFVQIFLEGNNQTHVSKLINQSQGWVSKTIIKIREKIGIILKNLDYNEINYLDKA